MKTLDEQIADLERRANLHRFAAEDARQVADAADRELAALRAKRDAEASKTVGQRMAEEMVFACNLKGCNCGGLDIGGPFARNPRTVVSIAGNLNTAGVIAHVRQTIAAAIDQAVADEREACAKLALEAPVYRSVTTQQQIADAIRGRAK